MVIASGWMSVCENKQNVLPLLLVTSVACES